MIDEIFLKYQIVDKLFFETSQNRVDNVFSTIRVVVDVVTRYDIVTIREQLRIALTI